MKKQNKTLHACVYAICALGALGCSPQTHTESGDLGGMGQLPPSVQTLLTDDLITSENTIGRVFVPRLDDLSKFRDLISKGDPNLRTDSDVNRGILRQVSSLAGYEYPDPAQAVTFVDENGRSIEEDEMREILDDLLKVAADDTTAVTDFLTGRNTDNVMTNGSMFDADRHLDALLSYEWGEDRGGIGKMFEWLGENAGNTENPYLGRKAADTAQSLAEYFVSGDNRDISASLGERNPHLANTLATALSPHLGEFVGVHDPNIRDLGETRSLGSIELVYFFAAMNFSGESSAIINEAGWQWQNALAYQFGLNPDEYALARKAGRLGEVMALGYNQKLSTLEGDAADQFHEDSANYDLAGVSFLFPDVDLAGVSSLIPDVPELNLPESGATLDDTSPTGSATSLQWAMVIGMLEADPILAQRYQEFYNDEGVLDFETAQDSVQWMQFTESLEFADFERQFGRGEKDAMRLPHPMDPPDMGPDTRPSDIGQDEGEGHR